MRAAEQLRENCARSTLQTLDLEIANSWSRSCVQLIPPRGAVPLLPRERDACRRCCERLSVHQIPIHATDPDRTRSCLHLMAGTGALRTISWPAASGMMSARPAQARLDVEPGVEARGRSEPRGHADLADPPGGRRFQQRRSASPR